MAEEREMKRMAAGERRRWRRAEHPDLAQGPIGTGSQEELSL